MDQLLYLILLISASVFVLNYYKKRSRKNDDEQE